MAVILSLAMPLDKAKGYFTIITVAFGFLTITTLAGIIFTFASSGIFPPEKCYSTVDARYFPCNPDDPDAPPPTYFSFLVLFGTILLCIYFVPCIYRPVDFLSNFCSYTIGFLMYLLMIPMFSNVFTIYAMCNLHDISWGNRPTTNSSGTEAFTASQKKQAETKVNYEVFRASVLFLWIISNGAYFIVVINLPASTNGDTINDGSFSWLQGFTAVLAGLVVFRVLFATLYLAKWKWRYCCNKRYSVNTYNMEKQFKKIKATAKSGGMSTDDEEVIERVRDLYKAKQKKINKKKKLHDGMTERQKLEATLDWVHEKDIKDNMKRKGKLEQFAFADVEEVEDKLIERKKLHGKFLTQDEVVRISNNVNVKNDDLNLSVLESVMDRSDFV